MGTFRRFEEIKAWQSARDVTRKVYEITNEGKFARDFGLRDQLRRASASVMANIAEGFGRNSDKEFANFLNIAIGSAIEAQTHLYIALDQKYIDQSRQIELHDNFTQIVRMCKSLSQHLRGRKS